MGFWQNKNAQGIIIALGGNKINAPAPIGGVTIDLRMICMIIDTTGGAATCGGVYQNTSARPVGLPA